MSPIAGYHAASDMVLLLDVARFKYPPYWVSIEALWAALLPVDHVTGHSRGWCWLSRPVWNDEAHSRCGVKSCDDGELRGGNGVGVGAREQEGGEEKKCS